MRSSRMAASSSSSITRRFVGVFFGADFADAGVAREGDLTFAALGSAFFFSEVSAILGRFVGASNDLDLSASGTLICVAECRNR
jgi:hypothetical protein